jgi:flavodoxin
MKNVLIAYSSRTGTTRTMANYIAEGLRMAGQSVDLKSISAIENEKDLEGYDGFVFGCPTYHKDMTNGMKQFLFKAEQAGLGGKTGGAFGSHTHSGESAPMIFDTMEHVFKMSMISLGPLNLTEAMVEGDEGCKACQDYGRALGEQLG